MKKRLMVLGIVTLMIMAVALVPTAFAVNQDNPSCDSKNGSGMMGGMIKGMKGGMMNGDMSNCPGMNGENGQTGPMLNNNNI